MLLFHEWNPSWKSPLRTSYSHSVNTLPSAGKRYLFKSLHPFVQASADGTVEQVGARCVGIARAADSAEETIPLDGIGMALAKHFIADPKDQNPGQKKGQIKADKPWECDGNHGFVVL